MGIAVPTSASADPGKDKRVKNTWYKSKKWGVVRWLGAQFSCSHGRERTQCKECGGSQICEHGRKRSDCKECGGSSFCEHGRQRSDCKECGGGSFCEHGRRRRLCKECGGTGICEHGRQRSKCKECGGHVTVLEAVEVEELDAEEEPDEGIITVQSRVVVGLRGGKRKRQC